MRRIRKVLPAVLTLAMLMSMIVLPVSAEETTETISAGETKSCTLDYEASEMYLFTPEESGRYIVYVPQGTSHVDICDKSVEGGDGYLSADSWSGSGSRYSGKVFDAEAGKTYEIGLYNWGFEATTIEFTVTLVKASNYETIQFDLEPVGFVGEDVWINIQTTPKFASEAVTWISSDPEVAQIVSSSTSYAQLKAIAAGTATITATTESGLSASCVITVKEKSSLQLGESVDICVKYDGSEQFSFTPAETGRYIFYTPSDAVLNFCAIETDSGTYLENSAWDSGDGQYFGYVFDMTAGVDYTLEVYNWSYDESDVNTSLTVAKAVDYEIFDFGFSETSRYVGEKCFVEINVGPMMASETITWTSSDPNVAMIESCSGSMAWLELREIGSSTITATTASGKTTSYVVHVVAPEALTLNEAVTFTLYPEEYILYSFTAPADGVYSVYAQGGVSGCGIYVENESGEWVEADTYWYRSGVPGCDYTMGAGETYVFEFWCDEENPTTFEAMIGQSVDATGMTMVADQITTYPNVCFSLNVNFEPILAKEETVSWSSSDPNVAVFYEAHEEETGLAGPGFKAVAPGTAIITATSENGLTAACEVTVLEPEVIGLGTHQTPVLDAMEYTVYTFIPETSGEYNLYLSSEMDFIVNWSSLAEEEKELWKGEDYVGFKAQLEAGEEYTIFAQNFYVQEAQSFTFYLEKSGEAEPDIHTHTPVWITGKAPTYTAPGNVAYCICSCGKLFTDDSCTVETTVAAVILPQLILVEDTFADISSGAIDKAAEDITTGGEVKIPVADAGENVESAALPVESLTQVADKEASLTLEMSAATVTMDTAALAAVVTQSGENATVTLEVTQIEEEELTEAQQEALQDKNVFATISAQLLVGGQPIASESAGGFGGGKVTVKIPFTPDPGTTEADYSVLYIADDGTTEEIATTYEEGYLVLVLEHFSDYVILKNVDILLGDVNGDGQITVLDLMRLANHFANSAEISAANADVNGDGSISVLDLMRLANYFAGKSTLG